MNPTSDNYTQTSNGDVQLIYAEKFARYSNWEFEKFLEASRHFNQARKKLDTWMLYFENQPLWILTILWAAMCLAEASVSYELYRDISNTMPPAVLILGIVAVGILISHFFRLQSSAIFRFETHYTHQVEQGKLRPYLEEEMGKKKHARTLVGVILLLGMLLLITMLSVSRVELESQANIRTLGFNPVDVLPPLFYVAEVVFGVYVLATFKQTQLQLITRHYRKKREKHLRRATEYNEKCGAYYQEARRAGYNEMESHELYIALQRYFQEATIDPTAQDFSEPVRMQISTAEIEDTEE